MIRGRSVLFLAGLSMGVGLLGCGDGLPDSEMALRTDSAGIQIVESFAPVWGEQGARIDPELLLRIGREEEGPYQFGSLNWARFLRDGGIVVPAGQSREIRFFDASGRHLRSAGRRGEGPGEFEIVSRVFPFPGDSVVAFDWRLDRYTIVSVLDGGFRSFPDHVDGNFSLFGVMGDGRMFLYSPGGSFHPELDPGLQWVATDVVVVDPSDGSPEVIASLPGRQQLVEAGGETALIYPALYSLQVVAKDGFYWGTPDRYEIGFYDATGRLRRVLRRDVEPVPVTSEMVQEWIEAQLDWVERYQGEEALPRYRQMYEEAFIRESQPYFRQAFVDHDQRLWVMGNPPDGGGDRAPTWSIYSPDGHWLGDVEGPEGVDIVDCMGDRVLGIWRDDLEVPYLQVHRLIVG